LVLAKLKIRAQLIIVGFVCAPQTGATIVRSHARRPPALFFLLFALSVPLHSRGCPVTKHFTYGLSLSSFTAILLNLHHTLYHEARQAPRGVSGQKQQDLRTSAAHRAGCKPALTLPSSISGTMPSPTTFELRCQDLLFSTELIQLKISSRFRGCDELSGRKRKFCDAGLPQS